MSDSYAELRASIANDPVKRALHNAAEFMSFYFVSPEAAHNREVEGPKNMKAEAFVAQRVIKEALAALERTANVPATAGQLTAPLPRHKGPF